MGIGRHGALLRFSCGTAPAVDLYNTQSMRAKKSKPKDQLFRAYPSRDARCPCGSAPPERANGKA
jgi:hypothetical protein